MKIFPKTNKEAIDLIQDILIQGDSRYNNFYDEIDIANALMNKAILLKERKMPKIKKPNEEELNKIYGLQKNEKYIAKILLKNEEFTDKEIFFEKPFLNYKSDIFAEKKNKIIIIECCSCKVRKVLDYLAKSNELWIIKQGELPWEPKIFNNPIKWFIFKKGKNWAKFLKITENILNEQLKKIKSPLDTLYS